MHTLVDQHRKLHPLMEPQDIVKLIFQAKLGCGHLLGAEEAVAARIAAEQAQLELSPSEPLTEPLGPDYVRVNLRRTMAEGIPPLWIARLMKLSPTSNVTRQQVVEALEDLQDEQVSLAAQRLLTEQDWLPSHTPAYHEAYHPAYRVVATRCARLLPVLIQAAQCTKERSLICIDGPCGSGKSTVAGMLRTVLDASLIPMDDFFLPHARKTPERLAQPGGNADWERMLSDVILPWEAGYAFNYRPYDCHADALAAPVEVNPSRFTILEGSYSLMPQLRAHADLCIFVQIDPHEQLERIRHRDGERALKMFVERWIPLEQAYFSAYSLPDEQCIVLEQST